LLSDIDQITDTNAVTAAAAVATLTEAMEAAAAVMLMASLKEATVEEVVMEVDKVVIA
jgi:hypothetical protein